MEQDNAFKFTGQVIEEPNALYPNDDRSKPANGHTVLLAQMGVSLPFFVSANDVPDPKEGDTISVIGKLVPNPKANGWPKCKATRAKRLNGAEAAKQAAGAA